MGKIRRIGNKIGMAFLSTSYITSQILSVGNFTSNIRRGLNYNNVNMERKNVSKKKILGAIKAQLSVKQIYTTYDWGGRIGNLQPIYNNDKNVDQYKDGLVIEFDDKDVIKKNELGSSIYAGIGTLANNLIKLTRINNVTGQEETIDLTQQDSNGNKGVQLIDDTDSEGNGTDKIVVNSMSSMNLMNFMPNTVYKLSIGNITNSSGNTLSNPQTINFATGPAPLLTLDQDKSNITNTGSSIDVSKLITDIKVDGSYGGFVIHSQYDYYEDDTLENVSQNTVKLYENGSSTPLSSDAYTVSLSGDKKSIVVKPNANKLEKAKIYSVVVNGVTDKVGNPIDNNDEDTKNQYRFYFETQDAVAPSVNGIYVKYAFYKDIYNEKVLHDGDKNIGQYKNGIVIEFKDKDVIKKNALGSSIYAGIGTLANNLIKLTRINNVTGQEETIDLTEQSSWGDNGIQLIDDTDPQGNGTDKIIVNSMSSMNVTEFMTNTVYKLGIGNITDASGNTLSNAQTISFTTGPAPVITLDKDKSNITNTGSSIDAAALITDIKVDGSYGGFVIHSENDNLEDDTLTNVSQDTVKLYENGSSTPLPSDAYTVSLSGDKKSIVVKPNANKLEKAKIYSVVVNGVTDKVGNPIDNYDGSTNNQYRFYFQTQDSEAPSINGIYVKYGWNKNIYNETLIHDGDKNVYQYDNGIVIEFKDKDVIKKNALGSSIYVGGGILANNLIKLTRINSITGQEENVDLTEQDLNGNKGIQLIDDTDQQGNGTDKIIVNSMSSMQLMQFMWNTKYKLSIGNITDASGNTLTNTQTINFTTGPAPVLTLDQDKSNITNTGSSIDAAKLITDIKVDGSYGGFVIHSQNENWEDDTLANVSQNTVKLYENGSSTPLSSDAYTVSLSGDKKSIVVKPVANKLEKAKIYSVVVNGVTDKVGNPIDNNDEDTKNQYRFYFETQDAVAPSINGIYAVNDWNKYIYNKELIHDGDKNISQYDNGIVIEFKDKDVVKKNALGSSIYVGGGILANNLIKLTRINNVTGQEETVDLTQHDFNGNSGIQLIDDTDSEGNGTDKIIVNSMSSMNLMNFMWNTQYKLSIGNITDASGNTLSNAQTISFITGPAPVLTLDQNKSNITNTGSSIDVSKLITDIKIDGSYGGFVIHSQNDNWENDTLVNVSQNTVKLYENGSDTPLSSDAYTVGLSEDKKQITVKPVANKLSKGKIYSVVVNGVTDKVGNPIDNNDENAKNQYRFYFETQDAVAPSINGIYAVNDWNKYIYNKELIHDGDRNVSQYDNGIIIEFKDKDVIKKNALGSSIYAGDGILANDLIKLTRINNVTGQEEIINLTQQDLYGNKGIQLIDDTDSNGNGTDKIIVNSMSSMNLMNFMPNTVYKLSIGNITDASGNTLSNAQTINFTTGPAPVLTLDQDKSNITNTGSSIDVSKLITDIKVDGSYGGFVIHSQNDNWEDDTLANVSQNTVKLYENGSDAPLPSDAYTVNLSSDKKQITVKPVANKLSKGKIYSVVVNGVTDKVGNPIDNNDEDTKNQYRFYFQTGDQVSPTIWNICTKKGTNGLWYQEAVVTDGEKCVRDYENGLVIDFKDKDVIKKNAFGSSIYAGAGILANDLIKLTRIDNKTGEQVPIDLTQKDSLGNSGVQLIDDTDPQGGGFDKIAINSMSSLQLVDFMPNTMYKLSIGNITDASGNVISNPQELSFTTGPAPVLTLDQNKSNITNTGSSIDVSKLITDIKVDGSYGGFVIHSQNDNWEDDTLENVSQNTVKLYENGSDTPLPSDAYTVSLSEDKKQITVKPVANKLSKGKIYSVVVNGVTDKVGNPIDNYDGGNQYRFYFQTEEGPLSMQVTPSNTYWSKASDGSWGFGGPVNGTDIGSYVIEFNNKDVIGKNQWGSSIYLGKGNLINDLIKLVKVDTVTGKEEELNLNGHLWGEAYAGNIVQVVDNTELNDSGYNSDRKDKIVVNLSESEYMDGIRSHCKYKLIVGNITDSKGNIVANTQTINFTTGPAPVLTINKDESHISNTGSSINAASLITNIKTDGSYNGFVLDAGKYDEEAEFKNVSQNTVKLYEDGSSTPLSSDAYTVTLSSNGKKINIKPNANKLQNGKIYSVVVNGVTDQVGNLISNKDGNANNEYRFYFKTNDSNIVTPPQPPVVVPVNPPVDTPVMASTVTPSVVQVPKAEEVEKANNFVPKENVEPGKTWTINFKGQLDANTANATNMIVFDSKGNIVKVKVDVEGDGKTVTITPVNGSYNFGETYTLYINKNVKSAGGASLKSAYVLKFTIQK